MILAVLSFFILHAFAEMAPDPGGPSTPAHLGTVVGRSALIAVARIVQYVLPILLLILAALSALRSHRDQSR